MVVPIGDGFDKALPGVLRARRRRHSDVDDFPTGQVDVDEAVEDLEPQRDDGQEVAGPSLTEMVADKCGPGLSTVARQVRWSVLGDGSRRHLVAKLAKLAGDSVLTPERVFRPSPANHGP